jgi:hypothetical protein
MKMMIWKKIIRMMMKKICILRIRNLIIISKSLKKMIMIMNLTNSRRLLPMNRTIRIIRRRSIPRLIIRI